MRIDYNCPVDDNCPSGSTDIVEFSYVEPGAADGIATIVEMYGPSADATQMAGISDVALYNSVAPAGSLVLNGVRTPFNTVVNNGGIYTMSMTSGVLNLLQISLMCFQQSQWVLVFLMISKRLKIL